MVEHQFEQTDRHYSIVLKGHLDDSWSDRLGGMVITRAFTEDKQPMSILIGRLSNGSPSWVVSRVQPMNTGMAVATWATDGGKLGTSSM